MNGCEQREIEELKKENWQLKGALGYEVPGDVPCGDFHCGMCRAKEEELEETEQNYQQALVVIAEFREEVKRLEIQLKITEEMVEMAQKESR